VPVVCGSEGEESVAVAQLSLGEKGTERGRGQDREKRTECGGGE